MTFDQIVAIIADIKGWEKIDIIPISRLREDLHMNDFEIMEFFSRIETETNRVFSDSEIETFRTVAHLVSALAGDEV